ncbi:MAG: hypothetical protein JNM72_19085 [Deltaproteobacteria bacterium]|nr:hypothetical protein [Deltaproteobacteria bacterium]
MTRTTKPFSTRTAALGLTLCTCSGDGKIHAHCVPYNLALGACMSDAGVSLTDADFDQNACAKLDGEPYPAYFTCVAEALAEVDCSTTAGIRAASTATAPCRALLTFPHIDEELYGYASLGQEQ